MTIHYWSSNIRGQGAVSPPNRSTKKLANSFIFYVGDKGVVLFDPLEMRAERILKSIRTVTDQPVTWPPLRILTTTRAILQQQVNYWTC